MLKPGRFSRLAQVAIGLPILALPWLFGGVQPAVQLTLFAGVFLSLLCYLGIWYRGDKANSSAVAAGMIPVLLALGFGLLQISSLPASVLSAIARQWSQPPSGSASDVLINKRSCSVLQRRPGTGDPRRPARLS
jgi:hypothetical protein